MFPSLATRETYVAKKILLLGNKKCLLSACCSLQYPLSFVVNQKILPQVLKAKTLFVSEQQNNLFPQHMFPARLNWETFASATMFP